MASTREMFSVRTMPARRRCYLTTNFPDRVSGSLCRHHLQRRTDQDHDGSEADVEPVLERVLRSVRGRPECRLHRSISLTNHSCVTEDTILAIQVFDQKKFKKKDQGFLGVVNIRIGDVIELAPDADGKPLPPRCLLLASIGTRLISDRFRPDAHARPEKVE